MLPICNNNKNNTAAAASTATTTTAPPVGYSSNSCHSNNQFTAALLNKNQEKIVTRSLDPQLESMLLKTFDCNQRPSTIQSQRYQQYQQQQQQPLSRQPMADTTLQPILIGSTSLRNASVINHLPCSTVQQQHPQQQQQQQQQQQEPFLQPSLPHLASSQSLYKMPTSCYNANNGNGYCMNRYVLSPSLVPSSSSSSTSSSSSMGYSSCVNNYTNLSLSSGFPRQYQYQQQQQQQQQQQPQPLQSFHQAHNERQVMGHSQPLPSQPRYELTRNDNSAYNSSFLTPSMYSSNSPYNPALPCSIPQPQQPLHSFPHQGNCQSFPSSGYPSDCGLLISAVNSVHDNSELSSPRSNEDDISSNATITAKGTTTSTTDVNRPKRRYRKRIQTVTEDGQVICVAVPRIIKTDIRRQYLTMLTNVLNSCDFPFMYSFIHTFASRDVMLLKQGLFLNDNTGNNTKKVIESGNEVNVNAHKGKCNSKDPSAVTPPGKAVCAGEVIEDVTETLAPCFVKHWPPYDTGFGPHKPPEDYKPILPHHIEQGICVRGRSLVTYYWMSLLQLIPDQVMKFEEVKVVTQAGSLECYVVCKFTAQGIKVYDISYHDMLEDMVEEFAKKCSLKRKDKEEKRQDTQQTREMDNDGHHPVDTMVNNVCGETFQKRRKTSTNGEESDSEGSNTSFSTETSKSSNTSESSTAMVSTSNDKTDEEPKLQVFVQDVDDKLDAKDDEMVVSSKPVDALIPIDKVANGNEVEEDCCDIIDEEDLVSSTITLGERCNNHPKYPSFYHDPVAARAKHGHRPAAIIDTVVQVQGLFFIHIDEDRQIRTLDFRLAFPSMPSPNLTSLHKEGDSSKCPQSEISNKV